MKIEKTKFYSRKIGDLAKGCKQCVKGQKLVLFVTGICPRRCYYCPISDKKYGKDVIYANERPITNINQIIEEAKLCDAKGAGFTGGDPLCKLFRTTFSIGSLKKKFGKRFHIHLYTSFDLVNKDSLRKLYRAGLDDIRFHPDIENDKLWNKILLAERFEWDIGVEIPIIPDKLKETKKLIDYFYNKIDFLNLNELEIADNKMSRLSKLGFLTKSRISYAVKGSEDMALELMKYIVKKRYNLNVHYCAAKLKDRVQLGERIKRRAKNVAKPYDIVDEEGLLIRGAIYCKDLVRIRKELMKEFDIFSNLIEIDQDRKRLLTGAWIVDELKKELKKKKLKIAIVREYPTYDRLEVEVDFKS
ncbi:radical SAM protein [Candidatus Woesearchaeota archaeon]|nr:radical SAM protein [Candidatus Woesearchaeota archaeon]